MCVCLFMCVSVCVCVFVFRNPLLDQNVTQGYFKTKFNWFEFRLFFLIDRSPY